jgi:hypothetical protein
MKFQIAFAALTLTLALAACMGPEGNPNGQPYANEPGGTLAATPAANGAETYDPRKPAPPFQDMRTGATPPAPPPPR